MNSPSKHFQRITGSGITLRLSPGITAIAPDGSEVITRYWGKRHKRMSQHKLIVRELAKARQENREISREELLDVLEKEIGESSDSHREEAKLRERLSTLLSQLKRDFAPNVLIEKTQNGYRLHSSVKVEKIEASRTNFSPNQSFYYF